MTDPITTPEALDALPLGTVVLDRHGMAWQRNTPFAWSSTDVLRLHRKRDEFVLPGSLPATVLFRPEAPTPTAADLREEVVSDLGRDLATARDGIAGLQRDINHLTGERDAARTDLAALRDGVQRLITQSGPNLSCGGYSIADDGCFAGDLATRLRALLGADPSPSPAGDDPQGALTAAESLALLKTRTIVNDGGVPVRREVATMLDALDRPSAPTLAGIPPHRYEQTGTQQCGTCGWHLVNPQANHLPESAPTVTTEQIDAEAQNRAQGRSREADLIRLAFRTGARWALGFEVAP